jgi:hypothetical protein
MQAFIVRPFGTKKTIDFDRVERELIEPALSQLAIAGRTTADSLRAGNIQTEMFYRLLTADLVIADISIHNANVFFELGVRHALREKHTYMIRCASDDLPPDQVPFDIATNRYLAYDPADPSKALATLVEGLRQTIRSADKDSPIFRQLPNLREQSLDNFLVVPLDFVEEVERAADRTATGDLELLAAEARGFRWEIAGLRYVGRAQYRMKAFSGARVTWEAVRQAKPDDLEANTLLGTIHQRLGDLVSSDQALRRVVALEGLKPYDRAEAWALLARNAKTRWRDEWQGLAGNARSEQALVSGHLEDSANLYAQAFNADLNHYYSGLNALAMSTIEVALASRCPNAWGDRFDDTDEARRALEDRRKKIATLTAAVDLSIRATLERAKAENRGDIWAEISQADLVFLATDRPSRVTAAYKRALAGADAFACSAAASQIEMYRDLGVLGDNVTAALAALPEPTGDSSKVSAKKSRRVVLFTGHRIDEAGRAVPRFPADKEAVARAAIRDAIAAEGDVVLGIAGGANGGDILFHEVCGEVGITTDLFLAIPADRFIAASVSSAGPAWVERFWKLWRRDGRQPRVLSSSDELPLWLQEKPQYSIWQRNNLWELYNALAAGDEVTLLALWNGEKDGDGPGGTADLVSKAHERGAKTIILATKTLFGL